MKTAIALWLDHCASVIVTAAHQEDAAGQEIHPISSSMAEHGHFSANAPKARRDLRFGQRLRQYDAAVSAVGSEADAIPMLGLG